MAARAFLYLTALRSLSILRRASFWPQAGTLLQFLSAPENRRRIKCCHNLNKMKYVYILPSNSAVTEKNASSGTVILQENVENTNDSKEDKHKIMEEVGQTKSSFNRIRKRQADFIGHIVRGEVLEHLMITGEVGRRTRQGETQRTNDRQSSCVDEGRTSSLIQPDLCLSP